jgi:hypothetical protein
LELGLEFLDEQVEARDLGAKLLGVGACHGTRRCRSLGRKGLSGAFVPVPGLKPAARIGPHTWIRAESLGQGARPG